MPNIPADDPRRPTPLNLNVGFSVGGVAHRNQTAAPLAQRALAPSNLSSRGVGEHKNPDSQSTASPIFDSSQSIASTIIIEEDKPEENKAPPDATQQNARVLQIVTSERSISQHSPAELGSLFSQSQSPAASETI